MVMNAVTLERCALVRPLAGAAYRPLFMAAVAWGALIVWLAPHPPMIDLPQHAGQVALLRDMLLGVSRWSELFRINLATPYLIGYGLALPLSLLMPIAAALKLLISLAYVAFVGMCVLLRRHFYADPRLDWLFLVSFFGFAFTWGLFTFLVAAPIGLGFIYLADVYAGQPTPRLGFGLLAVGFVLLLSHGLVFLFAAGVGVALWLGHGLGRLRIRALFPYALLGLACAAYFLVNRKVNAGIRLDAAEKFSWEFGPSRLYKAVLYSAGPSSKDGYILFKAAAVALLFAVPWLLGLRVAWSDRARWVPVACVAAVLLCVPNVAAETAYLYQRFAIFLLPAYAWMFSSARPVPRPVWLCRAAAPLAMAMCVLVLGVQSVRVLRFGKEAGDFDALIAQLPPNRRAAVLALDQYSAADKNDKIYAHYALWYQAEKHGLVDFNFAWFPPQIVRFRPDRLPAIAPGFDWHPERFDWKAHRGQVYQYFFVRHRSAVPSALFRGAPCRPRELSSVGTWTVYERQDCAR